MNGHKKPKDLSHKSDAEMLDMFKQLAEELDKRHLITLPYFARLDGIIHHVERHVSRREKIQRL